MPETYETSLAIFSRAAVMLAEADTIQKTKELKDLALTAADWAKRKGLGEEAIHYARSYALEAERKMGQLLAETERNPGTRGQLIGPGVIGGNILQPPMVPTLADLGLTKRESSDAQRLAALPEETFEAVKTGEKKLAQAYREAKRQEQKPPPSLIAIPDVTLIHGDMLIEVPKLGKFDLILADPPYGVTDWAWDRIPDYQRQVQAWLQVLKSALADSYHLFWFCSPKWAADTELIFRELSLPIKSRIVWHRRNMAMGSDAQDKFLDSWEMIFHAGNTSLNWPAEWDSSRFDVQTFAVPQTNFTDQKRHPTQKPLELIKWLVSYGSRPGQKVLDPFAGAGTTGIACNGNRPCTLIEREAEYIGVIKSRLGI